MSCTSEDIKCFVHFQVIYAHSAHSISVIAYQKWDLITYGTTSHYSYFTIYPNQVVANAVAAISEIFESPPPPTAQFLLCFSF